MEFKKEQIIFNGAFFDADTAAIRTDNRAFLYGDGLFETLRVVDGKVCFFEHHFGRLLEGVKALKMQVPANFTLESILEQCNELAQLNAYPNGGARLRITVFRNPGGFYLPSDNFFSYTIISKQVENNYYKLNENGLAVDVFSDLKKPVNKLANFKTLNTQLFILASIDAQEKYLDETLIVNDKGNVIESASSNLFLVSNGVLYTPSLDEGCLAGVMRMQIINLALELKFKVYECALTPQRLLSADEIFLTNTAKGIQWVSKYRAKRFFHKTASFLLTRLNDKLLNSTMDPQESELKQQISAQG